MTALNETHNPGLASWVEFANVGEADFPVQNLPFGIFRRRGSQVAWREGVVIGDEILDLSAAHAAGVFSEDAARVAAACGEASQNTFMAMGSAAWSGLRLPLRPTLHALESPQLQRQYAQCWHGLKKNFNADRR